LNVAAVPLNASAVAPTKFVPLIVTLAPGSPLAGVNPVIVGGLTLTTVKAAALVAAPPGVVTLTGPVVAVAGTVATIAVSDVTLNEAAVPLNATAVASVRLEPLIVTLAPTAPLAGEKLVIVGGRTTVKLPVLVALPVGVLTVSGPVVAPDGTVA
jgi:hypothetical protein